jgi:hypothetical protein
MTDFWGRLVLWLTKQPFFDRRRVEAMQTRWQRERTQHDARLRRIDERLDAQRRRLEAITDYYDGRREYERGADDGA